MGRCEGTHFLLTGMGICHLFLTNISVFIFKAGGESISRCRDLDLLEKEPRWV